MKRWIALILIPAPILALLYFSLTRDPRALPSALLDKPAPDFTLMTLEGEKVSQDGLTGKPLVLSFWSTWCGPCVTEHRLIQQLLPLLSKGGFRIYSILYEDTAENAAQFIAKFGKGAPILIDASLRTAIDYGVSGVPETFFVDAGGVVRFKHAGAMTADILLAGLKMIGPKMIGPHKAVP